MSGEQYGPHGLIKSVLRCDDETAEAVRRNLGGVLDHAPTRAFIAKAWHLANTTVPAAKPTDRTVYINEGKRMAGLFLVQCAKAGMDLTLFTDLPEPKENT